MNNNSLAIFVIVYFFLAFGLIHCVSSKGLEKAKINVKHCISTDDYEASSSTQLSQNKIDVTCTGSRNLITNSTDRYYIPYNCKFQLYDGTILHWSSNEDDRWSYKELRPGKSDSYHCGVSVKLPTNDTTNGTGLYKCWITYTDRQRKEHKMGGMVNILDPNSKNSTPEIIAKDIYVARGDDFMIECQAPNEIDLCFIKSPDGTLYAVTQNITSQKLNSLISYQIDACNIENEQDNSYDRVNERKKKDCAEALKKRNELKNVGNPINRLELTGQGFDMGVCATVIENAHQFKHNGTWTCQLDLVNGIEIQKDFAVYVKKSYLIGSVEKNGTITTLQCNKFPDFSSNIINCRWILPNMTGIYKEKSKEFSVMQDKNRCTLRLNEWKKEYAGEWQCYAQFKFSTQPSKSYYSTEENNADEEIFDAIEKIVV